MTVPSRTQENGTEYVLLFTHDLYSYVSFTCSVKNSGRLKISTKAEHPRIFSQPSTFVIPAKQRFRVNDPYFH
jgi:hypothetical protein